MPRNNSAARRAERRIKAMQRLPHHHMRLIATVSLELQRIRQNEDERLCDICAQPKRVCVALNTDVPDPHIFSPMTPQQQLKIEEEREVAELYEEDLRNQHFPGHAVDCTMQPKICYATAGISAAR